MNSASQALVTAAFTIAMAGAVGYGIYRAIAPKHKATGPVDIGRRWFAWMALLVTVSSLPPFFRLFNVDSILTWAIGLVFFGGLAFGLGWLYAKLFRFKGGNTGDGSAATAPSEGVEEERYAAIQDQRRIFVEQERAAQLQRIADLKNRARNWGLAAMIPAWIAGLAVFMSGGAGFGIASLMSALLAPISGLLVYAVAAGIKLSGEPRPDLESEWVTLVLVGGAILWVWLAN